MKNYEKDEFNKSLIALTIICLLSLFVTYILFKFLYSSASVEYKYFILGGAIAGFFVVYKMLDKTFYKLLNSGISLYKKSSTDKIKILEDKICDILFKEFNQKEPPFRMQRYINTDYKFSICYPDIYKITESNIFVVEGIDKFLQENLKKDYNRVLQNNDGTYISDVSYSYLYNDIIYNNDNLFYITVSVVHLISDECENKNIDEENIDDEKEKKKLDCFGDLSESYINLQLENAEKVSHRYLYHNNSLFKELIIKGETKDGFERKIIIRGTLVNDNMAIIIKYYALKNAYYRGLETFEKVFNTFKFVK